MELKSLEISNYRSIKELEIEISEVEESKTFALLGINESGKSSFLQALSLFNDENINYPLDYFDQNKAINIEFKYKLTSYEQNSLYKHLIEDKNFPEELAREIIIKEVYISVEFDPDSFTNKTTYQRIVFKNEEFDEYILHDDGKIEKTNEATKYFNIHYYFNNFLSDYFIARSHEVVFWKSSSKYLILDEISLPNFANNPEEVSIPLLNCFQLAGIESENIKQTVNNLTSPVQINNLQEKLSELVTEHINKVWPEHPIKIKFQISNNEISLLVEDEGVKYEVKTSGQRSDGFKQFISFLLTLSVKNHNEELKNTILLIDEPEVHLHPPAQINLLKELIEITRNDKNNIVFFATHSNYLIDKNNLERCYQVTKENNHTTRLKRIKKSSSTYAEVNFEVFNIPTTDYHNELYGYLEDVKKDKLNNLKKNRKWKNAARNGEEESVSLPKFIRHSIHHPENNLNKTYTDKDLVNSINALRDLKYNI